MIPPTAFVSQKDCFHCFPACLSSFLKENGKDMTQEQIVDACPVGFAKGGDIQGAFSPQSFDLLTKCIPCISVIPITSPSFFITLPKQTVVFLVNWKNTGAWHWVRFIGQDAQKVYLMNPAVPNKVDDHNNQDWLSWIKVGFIIEYK